MFFWGNAILINVTFDSNFNFPVGNCFMQLIDLPSPSITSEFQEMPSHVYEMWMFTNCLVVIQTLITVFSLAVLHVVLIKFTYQISHLSCRWIFCHCRGVFSEKGWNWFYNRRTDNVIVSTHLFDRAACSM